MPNQTWLHHVSRKMLYLPDILTLDGTKMKRRLDTGAKGVDTPMERNILTNVKLYAPAICLGDPL